MNESRTLPVLPASEPLPVLYARWTDEFLGGPIPRESNATCTSCAMIDHSEAPSGGAAVFRSDTKCCSLVPAIPNFLVGQVLRDSAPEGENGRESILARIEDAVSVTPLALSMPATFTILYKAGPGAFGKSRSFRCPHFVDLDGGKCGVWQHRSAVCATYFCKHARGWVGREFWSELRELFNLAEYELSLWSAVSLGLEPDCISALLQMRLASVADRLPAELMESERETSMLRFWGGWRGREIEFYKKCSALVSSLTWTQVLNLCGATLRVRQSLVERAYERLISRKVPRRLACAALTSYPMGRSFVRVSTYSPLDPLLLSEKVFAVLHYFDGSPTNETLERIAAESNTVLSEELVRTLVDYGLLREVD